MLSSLQPILAEATLSERSIRFAHLGLTFSEVKDHITVFGIRIAYYGIVIACGMLLAGLFILWEGKRIGFTEDDLLDITLCGIVCGVLGARIYYVLFSWDYYSADWTRILRFREGGLAIYGGILGGLVSVIVMTRRKKLPFFGIADVVIFGVVIGQILGRWGNFFNREAFGEYTDGLFAMQLPLSAVRQADAVTDAMRAHLVEESGITWISVHPTFLYESLWNACVLAVLFFVVRRHKRWEGEVFFSYLLLYGAGRLWIEGLRTDQLLIPGTALPVSQCLAASCVVLAAGVLSYQRRKRPRIP